MNLINSKAAGHRHFTRREALSLLVAGVATGCLHRSGPAQKGVRVATFSADVTVPLGHGMMGGSWLSKTIADSLEAHGLVFLGDEPPVVFVSVDWCEIRNDAYARWQTVLAEAAGTVPERVMVSAIHQHDAPIADLEAERILRSRNLQGTVCDPEFHEKAVQNVAAALRESLATSQPVTHIGKGQAKVEQVASNRRFVTPDGAVQFSRTSSTQNPAAIAADEGLIDPWLKTLSFWNGESQIAAVSFYAVHPMSYYGRGEVSADFPGIARRSRQAATPGTLQIYCSGASGNITAGKYNKGDRPNRQVLASRLIKAMEQAAAATVRQTVSSFAFRNVPLDLKPRESAGFKQADLEAQLTPESKPFTQCLAAMGLSWRKRVAEGHPLPLPVIDFGTAAILLLPGEAYVEYQLAAQAARPGDFICVAGYGDAPAGYNPTEKHWQEKDGNLHDWCWIEPGAEETVKNAIKQVLREKKTNFN